MCGQVAKDFHKLLRNVDSFSAGQAKITNFEDDLEEFVVEIIPADGVYQHGKFKFQISTKDYPFVAPEVHCQTKIYHPNIDLVDDEEEETDERLGGDVCLNLFDEWNASNDLQDCVQGLLFLMYNPNLEDPLNPMFSPSDYENYNEFVADVRKSLKGEEIDGYKFERNLVCCEDCNHVVTLNMETDDTKEDNNVIEHAVFTLGERQGSILEENFVNKTESEVDALLRMKSQDETASVAENSKVERVVSTVHCDKEQHVNCVDHVKLNEKLKTLRWLCPAMTMEFALTALWGEDLGLFFFRVVEVFVRTKVESSILEITSHRDFMGR